VFLLGRCDSGLTGIQIRGGSMKCLHKGCNPCGRTGPLGQCGFESSPASGGYAPVPIAAAVKTADGVIHFMPPPHRHHHTVHALHYAANPSGEGLIIARGEQGFVMSDGTFANREDAAKAALATGRIKALSHPPKLYSEDLW